MIQDRHTSTKVVLTLGCCVLAAGGVVSAWAIDCLPTDNGLTVDSAVDALDIGSRAEAQRAILRYRDCRPDVKGDAIPPPAGRQRVPLRFFAADSSELTPLSIGLVEKIAQAMRSDALLGFSFDVSVQRKPSDKTIAAGAHSAARTRKLIDLLVNQYGISPARLKSVANEGDKQPDSADAVLIVKTLRLY